MEIIKGAYSEAHILTTNNSDTALDQYARAQLQMICDNESSKGCLIRVMPDVHPGKVGTIGLTMTIGDRIIPNLIGIDIGCGMTLAQIKGKKVEGQKLDTVISVNFQKIYDYTSSQFTQTVTPHMLQSLLRHTPRPHHIGLFL
jgi:RNA-splicing ligase RtcB